MGWKKGGRGSPRLGTPIWEPAECPGGLGEPSRKPRIASTGDRRQAYTPFRPLVCGNTLRGSTQLQGGGRWVSSTENRPK